LHARHHAAAEIETRIIAESAIAETTREFTRSGFIAPPPPSSRVVYSISHADYLRRSRGKSRQGGYNVTCPNRNYVIAALVARDKIARLSAPIRVKYIGVSNIASDAKISR